MQYAVHEALRCIMLEGLQERFARHALNDKALCAGLQAMGLKIFGDLSGQVQRVAMCPGAGKSMIPDALAQGAQVLITGDIDHHSGIDAVAQGLSIIDAGHYGIEHIFISDMQQYLNRELPQIEAAAQERRDPFVVI